ncbi:hypothetical protein TNCV_2748461 [Trichonephila clavipes]|nr:hypothetical protein TNCV_2748461 [Trichonephila clavipes]
MILVDSGDVNGTHGKRTISLNFAVKMFASRSFQADAFYREHYGHPALTGNVMRTPKIQFPILTPDFKKHTGMTLDAPASASSVARGNENLGVGLECKTFPPNSGNILQKLREFLKYEIHVSCP